MSLTLQRIEFRGIRKSKGLKRFAEKRLSDWAHRMWSAAGSSLRIELSFVRPGEGHQVLCMINLWVEGKMIRMARYATNPYQALLSCLDSVQIPQFSPALPRLSQSTWGQLAPVGA
jgi:hypothetical protein